MEPIVWIDEYLKDVVQMIYDDRVDDAIQVMDNLLHEEPGYASLHNHLGWAYLYYKGNEARAELHFRAAIHFDASLAPPFLHMGELLSRKEAYGEAIPFYQEGLTKPKSNKPALFEGLAHAYEATKQFGKAMRAYKDAASASVIEYEYNRYITGVKRCRRKRLALFFTF